MKYKVTPLLVVKDILGKSKRELPAEVLKSRGNAILLLKWLAQALGEPYVPHVDVYFNVDATDVVLVGAGNYEYCFTVGEGRTGYLGLIAFSRSSGNPSNDLHDGKFGRTTFTRCLADAMSYEFARPGS